MLTVIVSAVALLEVVVIITMANVIKLCIRENVKLVRGVARSKNPEAFVGLYNSYEQGQQTKKHVTLAVKQDKSMRSGGE